MEKTEEEKKIIHLYLDLQVPLNSFKNFYGISVIKATEVINKYGLIRPKRKALPLDFRNKRES